MHVVATLAASSAGPVCLAQATRPHAVGFGAVNYVVLGAYLAALVVMGVYFSRRENTTDDYFRAGRRVPWWAAGLSIFGGGLSALTFMAVPAMAFDGDWAWYLMYLMPLAIIHVVTRCYIPFYRRLDVTSAYEYLEKRFNLPARLFASAYYVLFQFGRMAIVLYLPAVALSTVTGMNLYLCIVLTGLLATAYTVAGGIEAVVWTDVLQVVVLAGGAVIVLATVAADVPGGLAGILAAAGERDKFRVFRWVADPTVAAAWVMIVGNLFAAVMPNTADQSVVQRYLVTRDERSARRAAWTSALLGLPTGALFLLIGTSLFVYYRLHNPGELPADLDTNAILPLFVVQKLPAGVSGLVVAGIFAAAMSTLDNGMNAVSAAVTTDAYRRFRRGASERGCLRFARGVTLTAGVIATALAAWVARAEIGPALGAFMGVLSLFGGTLAGLFVLGIFTRRADGTGALIGGLVSAAATLSVRFGTDLHGVLYAAVGLTTCVLVGHVVGLLRPGRKDIHGLTIHTLPPERDAPPQPAEDPDAGPQSVGQ